MNIIRKRVIVHGRVQGVCFRASTQRTACDLGLTGWVRNRPDSSVEAVFEGPPDAMNAAVTWCRTGPPHALVETLEIAEEPPEHLTGFHITG